PGQGSLSAEKFFSSLTFRNEGSAVLYGDGKVLLTGGGHDPVGVPPIDVVTDTAEVIDLNAANPHWEVLLGRMRFPRKYATATILADGTVLVTGGTTSGGFNIAAGAVLEAELWDTTNSLQSWTTLARM